MRRVEKGEGETITQGGDHSERGKGTQREETTRKGYYTEKREETGDIHELPGTNTRGDYTERGLHGGVLIHTEREPTRINRLLPIIFFIFRLIVCGLLIYSDQLCTIHTTTLILS